MLSLKLIIWPWWLISTKKLINFYPNSWHENWNPWYLWWQGQGRARLPYCDNCLSVISLYGKIGTSGSWYSNTDILIIIVHQKILWYRYPHNYHIHSDTVKLMIIIHDIQWYSVTRFFLNTGILITIIQAEIWYYRYNHNHHTHRDTVI